MVPRLQFQPTAVVCPCLVGRMRLDFELLVDPCLTMGLTVMQHLNKYCLGTTWNNNHHTKT